MTIRSSVFGLVSAMSVCGPCASQVYVDPDANGNGSGSSWNNAITDLQAALAGAGAGTELRLAGGIYKPHPTDRTVSFVIPSGVIVRGGYRGGGQIGDPDDRNILVSSTILSGDLGNDDGFFGGPFNNREDNSFRVVDLTGTDSGTLLEGLTIADGEATISGGVDSGAGVGVDTTSDATLRHVRFFNNRAYLSGGAVQWNAGNGVLISCDFVGNRTIADGIGGGGGMQSGAGAGTRSLYNCRFFSNQTEAAGAGLYAAGDTLVVNGVFSGNVASDRGGAIYVIGSGSTCRAHNLTVHGNHAGECGGIHTFFLGRLELYASVLWANTDTSGGSVSAQQRCATGLAVIGVDIDNTVEGITATAPLFVDADGADDVPGTFDDDFTPDGLGSGLIDNADANDLPPDAPDLDGDGNTTEGISRDAGGGVRVHDAGLGGLGMLTLDRGAYELCPPLPLSSVAR